MSRYIRPFARGVGRQIVGKEEHLIPEFIHELGDDARIQLEPGYNQDELFDDQFERRAREKVQTPGAAGGIAIIPAKQGPWSGNNSLGMQREFAPDEENRQTILKLDEWGFPEVWTLALGLAYDRTAWVPTSITSGYFDLTAVINFGCGGVIQVVEIDWHNGAAISLPMNAVNVVAQFNPDSFADPSEPPDDLMLRCSMVHGPLPGAKPTRSYRRLITPAGGIDNNVDIPPFAKSVRITLGDPNVTSAQIFAFYSQPLGMVQFIGAPPPNNAVVRGAYRFDQLVEYLSIAESTVGPPVDIDIPAGVRTLFFDAVDDDYIVNVQFNISL